MAIIAMPSWPARWQADGAAPALEMRDRLVISQGAHGPRHVVDLARG